MESAPRSWGAWFVLACWASHWLCAGAAAAATPDAAETTERNNWAVIVETSRYWYNYRHVSNALSFYYTVKRMGIPDSQIILMLAEDMACNPRNSRPGMVFGEANHHTNLYGEEVEVDYRGDEVSIENFLRLLTGRHPPHTPRNKRLLTDSTSNVLIFVTAHSGEEFIKFQDWEEVTSTDIADAFEQMHKQRRYRQMFWVTDTCQAASLQNQFYSPNILAYACSGRKESSYSHHVDSKVGIAVIDRFTYSALDFFSRMSPTSDATVEEFTKHFDPGMLRATPELRSDLFPKTAKETKMVEFFAATSKMRFLTSALRLQGHDAENSSTAGSCAAAAPSFFEGRSSAGLQHASRTSSPAAEQDGDLVDAVLAWGAAAIRDILRPRQSRVASFGATASSMAGKGQPTKGSDLVSNLGEVPMAVWLVAFGGVAVLSGVAL